MSYMRLLTGIKVLNNFCRGFSSSTREKSIKLDKWNINYVKVGRGPHHVFCLPGALGTIWTDFRPQIEGFDREKFTLVVWDPPGYGKSRPPDKNFAGHYYKRDVDHAFQFMRALEIPKYSVMGWSDGAIVALFHAAKYPDATNKLVVISGGTKILPEKVVFLKRLSNVSAWSKTMRKNMTDIYGDNFIKYWNHWVDGHGAFLHVHNGDVCGRILKDIKCPTLVTYGEKDKISLANDSRNIVKNVLGSRSHVYPEGKHNIHIKYAEDFNARVQSFLLEQ